MKPDERLKLDLEVWLSKQGILTPFSLKKLAGDGSSRLFYRLISENKTWIVLFDPTWTLSQDYPAHQTFLKNILIPVPEFYFVDSSIGVLIMEDLGDELLQNRILSTPHDKMKWLKKAAELLADLHGKAFPVPDNLPCSKRRFDSKKYFEELSFTFEHLNNTFLELPMIEDLKRVENFTTEIANLSPLVFSHRDYHTRNILLHQNNLILIDFQDARLGSPHYDLASLIYDPYVALSQGDRNELIFDYTNRLSLYSVYKKINLPKFDDDLKKVALQRVVKAAGSFASFYNRYGKKTHLPYLLPALTSALQLSTELKMAPLFPIEKWLTLCKIK